MLDRDLAGELVRLRRMMREGKREELEDTMRSNDNLAGALRTTGMLPEEVGNTSID